MLIFFYLQLKCLQVSVFQNTEVIQLQTLSSFSQLICQNEDIPPEKAHILHLFILHFKYLLLYSRPSPSFYLIRSPDKVSVVPLHCFLELF